MTTFVLLHGAFHGPWCWEPLIERLEAAGHDTVAVDLPTDDSSATWDDHVNAVLNAARDLPSVLVGHSRAGRLMPLVLERRDFDAVIYIAAALPGPAGAPPRRCDSLPMLHPEPVRLTRDEQGRSICPPERALEMYYDDCPPDIRDWAVARLRPQCDVDYPKPQRAPQLPSLYIAGLEDRAVNIEWMRAAAIEVLGRPAIELRSGHCPFLSVTQELADAMCTFAEVESTDRHTGQGH